MCFLSNQQVAQLLQIVLAAYKNTKVHYRAFQKAKN
jgi:hypothetical protein